MITTVTLNASIDKAYDMANIVQIGSVMRVKDCRNTAGGKGLNVARVVHACGETVQATGMIGGHNGQYFLELMQQDGIPNAFVNVSHETRCCINILEPDGRSTEFLESGEEVSDTDIQKFISAFEDIVKQSDVITLSGSAPKQTDNTIYHTLVTIAKKHNKPVILDTSGVYLKEGLKANPTMIKPNAEELSALLGGECALHTKDELIKAGKTLFETGIENVVISLGKDGALLICEDGVFHGKPPKLDVVNTVGCGDAMVAAFAVAFKQNMTKQKALQYAVAVSAANAMNQNTGYFIKKDFENIYPLVVVTKQ